MNFLCLKNLCLVSFLVHRRNILHDIAIAGHAKLLQAICELSAVQDAQRDPDSRGMTAREAILKAMKMGDLRLSTW